VGGATTSCYGHCMRAVSFSSLMAAVVVWVIVVGGGCGQPYGSRHWPQSRERHPTLVFEPGADFSDAARFWDAPWPADARTLPSGAPDVRGLPNPFGVSFVDIARRSVMDDVTARGPGFSPLPVVSFRFDRPMPPVRVVPLSTIAPSSGIQLVDLTPERFGQRVVVEAHVTQARDSVRPASLLQLAPLSGLSLLPGRWAAIVQRDVDDDGVFDLDPHPALRAVIEGRHPDTAWSESFAPLREALPRLGIDVDDVAAATVFSVGDPTAQTVAFVQRARRDDPPTLVSLQRGRDVVNASGVVVELVGTLLQPQHQTGEPPHFAQTGVIVVDDDGQLQTTRVEEAPFVITLPRTKMPAAGFPLFVYVHGTGGDQWQAIDRGRREYPGQLPPVPGTGLATWIAPDGVATACVAGPYSPARIGERALDGYGAYVFMNPPAMRDNFAQMLIEHARFLRLLETVAIDPALAPEVDASASADGRIRFNPRLVLIGGHSLGSYLSGMLAGSLDEFAGVVLSGAGGTWVEFAFGPKDPVDLQGLVETVSLPPGEDLDRFHPFIDIFETGVAGADNTFFTRHILRHPRGARAPHVLVVQGHPDAQVPTGLQRALVRSVLVDFVGNDTGARSIDRLLPALHSIGRADRRGPVGENIDVPGVGLRTGVVVRYAEDGRLDGHNVLFQRDDTRAVFSAFVRDVVNGVPPVVAP
jgi:hypothetical protein